MKLADNPDRHRISDEFEFQPDWTIDFEVTCPLVPKKHIPPCPEHSLFSFDWIFMKVADNLDRHKIVDKFEFRQDHFGVTFP